MVCPYVELVGSSPFGYSYRLYRVLCCQFVLCQRDRTEFFPAQDNARIAVKLELPIGTRKELAQEISEKLTNYWLEHYKGIMKVCNYTVGQADSDNTFASMQDNGSHIISFNISLVDPGDRDINWNRSVMKCVRN